LVQPGRIDDLAPAAGPFRNLLVLDDDPPRSATTGQTGPGPTVRAVLVCPDCGVSRRLPELGDACASDCGCGRRDRLEPDRLRSRVRPACPLCGAPDLYARRYLPSGIGLAVVLAGFLASTIFWYFYRPVLALGALGVTALIDLAAYHVVPSCAICYRCGSRYFGQDWGRLRGFDLAVRERYRQERLRGRPAGAAAAPASESPPGSP
jgi:hypothetical protein